MFLTWNTIPIFFSRKFLDFTEWKGEIWFKIAEKGDFQVKMAKKVILAKKSKKGENLGYRWFTFSPSL